MIIVSLNTEHVKYANVFETYGNQTQMVQPFNTNFSILYTSHV